MYKLKTIGFYLILPSYILLAAVCVGIALLTYARHENALR